MTRSTQDVISQRKLVTTMGEASPTMRRPATLLPDHIRVASVR
jgi:hypothetical protein